jgi:glycosyltransferase involved in cell wall biosynthesis
MRVYQVNTMFGAGGAAMAACRLNQGLRQAGVDSWFLSPQVVNGQSEGAVRDIKFGLSLKENIWRRLRKLQIQQVRRRVQAHPLGLSLFGVDLSCYGVALLKACRDAQLLHFHWVNDLLDYPFVLPRLNPQVPLVWTLHDMNPFTGGCFYSQGCRSFQTQCGRCPELGSHQERDLSTEVWERKANALRRMKAPLSFVAPSEWLASEARRSRLLEGFEVRCIPNAVDTDLFRVQEKSAMRRQLGLNPGSPVVLFVAATLDNPWKGLRHLLEAMPSIQSRHSTVQFVSVGDPKIPSNWPVPVSTFSAREEKTMANLYAVADMLVVPSVADNFPNVILEAMACGVPTVGFCTGGIPEAIGRDEPTGLLAAEPNSVALADGVLRLLAMVNGDSVGWQQRCRSRALREFSLPVQAKRHIALYDELLSTTVHPAKK